MDPYLGLHVRDQAIKKGCASDLPAKVVGARPICKDFLKGSCKRGKQCKFRHLTSKEYDLEINRYG